MAAFTLLLGQFLFFILFGGFVVSFVGFVGLIVDCFRCFTFFSSGFWVCI